MGTFKVWPRDLGCLTGLLGAPAAVGECSCAAMLLSSLRMVPEEGHVFLFGHCAEDLPVKAEIPYGTNVLSPLYSGPQKGSLYPWQRKKRKVEKYLGSLCRGGRCGRAALFTHKAPAHTLSSGGSVWCPPPPRAEPAECCFSSV